MRLVYAASPARLAPVSSGVIWLSDEGGHAHVQRLWGRSPDELIDQWATLTHFAMLG